MPSIGGATQTVATTVFAHLTPDVNWRSTEWTTRIHWNNLRSDDGDVRYTAFMALLAITDSPVGRAAAPANGGRAAYRPVP